MSFYAWTTLFVTLTICYMYRYILILKFQINIIVLPWNVRDLCTCLLVKTCVLILNLKFIVVWIGWSVLLNICIIVHAWNVRDLCACLRVNTFILTLKFIVICIRGSVMLKVCIIVLIWNVRDLCICLLVNSCILILRTFLNIYDFRCFCMVVRWIDFWFASLFIIHRGLSTESVDLWVANWLENYLI